MKEGASNPFDDSTEETTDTTDAASDDAGSGSARTGTDAESSGRPSLPYIHARDTVKESRPNVHQLFVRDDTDREAKRAEMELEDILGEDVYRLDAREAIYLAGMQNLGDAAALLREWGYDWE
jgi:hypothetical protein